MIVYLDIIFIENLIMNFIILLATSVVIKFKENKIRLIIGAVIGAVYCVMLYIRIFECISNIISKFILSIIIVYIAFAPKNFKLFLRYFIVFYFISFVFGGAAFAFIYIIKPEEILMKNGLFLGAYPLKTIIIASISAYVIIKIVFSIVKVKFTKKDMYCKIELYIEGKVVTTNAMVDTGNLLKEPISNTPAIIVEKSLLYECVEKSILDNLENILGGDVAKIDKKVWDKYMNSIKLIPFSTVGKSNGMLIGIKIDKMKTGEKEFENVIIAIYNKSLTKRGEYRALIGIDFL